MPAELVGMHTHDTPPPTRQPKCQANWKGTPTILPNKLQGHAKENAKHFGSLRQSKRQPNEKKQSAT
jgi:hypothetical protein